jgi:hypothetical protein
MIIVGQNTSAGNECNGTSTRRGVEQLEKRGFYITGNRPDDP